MSDRQKAAEKQAAAAPIAAPRESSRRVLAWGLAGAVVTYLAHPPVGWFPLAWIGPAAWVAMIAWPRLPGRRPYGALWIAGLVHWLLTAAWLRKPHEDSWASLTFITCYLALYLPVFVGLSRIAVHRLRWPVWLAAPVVWTGLELARAHLLTGFLMGSLAQSQIHWTFVLQIAEYGGEYAVTFLIVLTASLLAEAMAAFGQRDRRRVVVRFLQAVGAPVLAIVGAFLIYAQTAPFSVPHRNARIALIQSDMLSDWKGTPQRDREVMEQQIDLSRQAVRESDQPLDLIVWPETMFRMAWHQRAEGYEPPEDLFPKLYGVAAEVVLSSATDALPSLVETLETPVLVGIDRRVWREPRPGEPPLAEDLPPAGVDSYNSSVMVDRTGAVVGTYDKMHLLPFGEYVPLVDWAPLLRSITPITGSAVPGEGPTSLALPLTSDPERTVRYAPNICYETALPHVIRRHVAELTDRGEAPDVLVNLTNDAWYWGSAELDMHLAAGVLRAVETRTPLVIAANRGLSAYIDEFGNVQAVTQRDTADVLLADVRISSHGRGTPTFYVRYGDWLPGLCLVCCTVFAVVGWRARRVVRRTAKGA